MEEDRTMIHTVTVSNQLGSTNYTFGVPTIEDSGLSGGAIAGIVIGCLAGVVLIGAGGAMVVKNQKAKKSKKIKQQEKKRRKEES
ncbi:L-type lectin-domain containing receptor kinase S.1 isoform X2 [Eurytemora carolleeae]|uniref:L-type lectin-domain containing receptor kinase S.1 isoform X2 n=1 Tax=Eurytemora carolleeae TaxID=1294199 RepID=UPI000C768F8E|nr:L-type lectin-domain containing receptor kinase S.1 isoform X2 [Eurytemora carolleeae]|eukprot:XP_023340578.1 L-type lectin-domain containing receptor kinase S.1-like isoform X2 [Eurytemora affinis]